MGLDLLLKFRSGTHGLNEELGRHRRESSETVCVICGAKCENVLWKCSTCKDSIMGRECKLQS